MSTEVFAASFIDDPVVHQRFIRKAGALYGIIVALGFILFFWLPDAMVLREAHYAEWWMKLVLGPVFVIPLGAAIGWLSASMRWSGLSIFVWMIGGSVLAWIGGRIQFDGMSGLIRLTDIYPTDQIMYPFTKPAAALTGIAMVVGLGAGLVIGVIALLVLERAWDASTRNYRFSPKSILWLALCLPVLLPFGLMADSQINASARDALTGVQHMIELVRDPNTDLARAKLTPLARYRADLSPQYTLYLNTINEELTRYWIDVQLDTGLLLRCPYMWGNTSLCLDLSTPLNEWMTSLVTVKDWTCADCDLKIKGTVRSWLNSIMPTLSPLKSVALLKHQGGWLYMRATLTDDRKIDCRFVGDQSITVDLCTEAQ